MRIKDRLELGARMWLDDALGLLERGIDWCLDTLARLRRRGRR